MTRLARLPGPISRNFALGSYEKFQPGFRDGKRQSEDFWREMRERKRTWRNTKIITFVSVIALATIIAVSLQLNGMLMMWKIQQATQDGAIRLKRSLKLAHMTDCSLFLRLLARRCALFHVTRSRVCNQARELILTNFLTYSEEGSIAETLVKTLKIAASIFKLNW